jgi:hypothetical protein
MGYTARERVTAATLTHDMALEALEPVLAADVALLLCVGTGPFARQALTGVESKLTHGLRLFWPGPEITLVDKGGISQARYRPVVALFHRLCRPLARRREPSGSACGLW